MSSDGETAELGRFPALREYISYGPSAWAAALSFIALIAVIGYDLMRTAPAPVPELAPAFAGFGFFTFIFGMFWGVMWAELRDDVEERREMIDGE